KPITIYGDGQQTRSFCYIDDLIKGIMLIINKGKKGEVYNLGSSKEIRIITLAKMIKKLTNSSSKLEFKPLPIDDPKKRKPDLEKIKKAVNWKPEILLGQGLQKTIEYFKLMING
ncbi:unnamed protein product, partial [marine sediment metagenome]